VLKACLLNTFWYSNSIAYQPGLMTKTILQPVLLCELQLCVAAQSTSLHKMKQIFSQLSSLFFRHNCSSFRFQTTGYIQLQIFP
jgi:hypothetical protein